MVNRPLGLYAQLQRFVGQLKSPTLLLLAGGLFVLDLVVPDPVPFVDEILLGIVTILLARWQNRRNEPPPRPKPPPKDVTPP